MKTFNQCVKIAKEERKKKLPYEQKFISDLVWKATEMKTIKSSKKEEEENSLGDELSRHKHVNLHSKASMKKERRMTTTTMMIEK